MPWCCGIVFMSVICYGKVSRLGLLVSMWERLYNKMGHQLGTLLL